MRGKIAFLILFVLLFHLVNAVGAEVIDFNVKPENPVNGEVVTIYGEAQPEEEVRIEISFENVVQVKDKGYVFSVEKMKIPEGENRLTVRAEGCENLKVSVRRFILGISTPWITLSSKASDGVAEISQTNVPAGTYDVLVHGKSSEESVRLIITAVGYEQADEAGNFSYTYETSPLPEGNFSVQAGNVTEIVNLRSSPRTSGGTTPTPTLAIPENVTTNETGEKRPSPIPQNKTTQPPLIPGFESIGGIAALIIIRMLKRFNGNISRRF
uniref:Uncharacterized protein n=1 Tax=Candidatus Methanophagaceae archaeon ANME-1 ERB6 TaxID=2759912 RepID=A0A7G9YYX9_9EURY|nr:hypothetical protein HNLOENAD_00013 [Methanosarcinales archaeon ANME-1 ERB6]